MPRAEPNGLTVPSATTLVRPLPAEFDLSKRIAAIDEESACGGKGIGDPQVRACFEPAMAAVQSANSNRDCDIERALAIVELEVLDCNLAKAYAPGSDLLCGG